MSDPEWEPGPSLISPQTRFAPLMLRMMWDGYPLFFSGKYGWGYLVPGRTDNLDTPPYDPPASKTAAKKKGAVIIGSGNVKELEEEQESALEEEAVFPTRYVVSQVIHKL